MTTAQREADQALKAKHRATWALGDYGTVAADLIPDMGRALVDACRVGAGDRVLDVAAGTGNAAIPAAERGATVVACDLTPELMAVGRELALRRGVDVEWREADAESLPFVDGEFDVVLSCVGVMFAPHHESSARELARVCRSGGTIGLANWTPEGFIGQMFAAMKPYVPPPPSGALPPPLWGDEDHVRSLFGPSVAEVRARRESVRVERFADPGGFVEYFKSKYGPTVAAYRGMDADVDRQAGLDGELAALARRHALGGDGLRMDWEYLVVTARKV